MPSNPIVPAEQCMSMSEVRAGVDHLDRALVELLAERFAYMRAAARIKTERASVRDESRKAEVIANVVREAQPKDIPAALVEQLWEILVETSISYEMELFDRGRP